MCNYVSVLNRFNTGSDHRLIRCKIKINLRVERKNRFTKVQRPTLTELETKSDEYQESVKKKIGPTKRLHSLSVNELNRKIVNNVLSSVQNTCGLKRPGPSKLTAESIKLIEQRRLTSRDSAEYGKINKNVKKAIRRDNRAYNT